MLPTPMELREQSRRFHAAAERASKPAVKRKLDAHAAALARVADILMREGESLRPETRGECERLLARPLGENMQEIVGALLSKRALPDRRSQAKNWRARAAELRSIADGFVVPSVQEVLRRAAASYDQLAEEAEAPLAGSGHKPRDEAG